MLISDMSNAQLRAWLKSLKPDDEVAVGYGMKATIEKVYLVEDDNIILDSYRQGSCENPSCSYRFSYDRETGRGNIDTAAVLGPVYPIHRKQAALEQLESALLTASLDDITEILRFIAEIR